MSGLFSCLRQGVLDPIASVLAGGHADKALEDALEVIGIVVAAGEGNLRYAAVRANQEVLGLADAAADDILHRRVADVLAERMGEVVGVEVQFCSDGLQGDALAIMGVDIGLDREPEGFLLRARRLAVACEFLVELAEDGAGELVEYAWSVTGQCQLHRGVKERADSVKLRVERELWGVKPPYHLICPPTRQLEIGNAQARGGEVSVNRRLVVQDAAVEEQHIARRSEVMARVNVEAAATAGHEDDLSAVLVLVHGAWQFAMARIDFADTAELPPCGDRLRFFLPARDEVL